MEPFGTTVSPWAVKKRERKCWKVSMSNFRFLVLRAVHILEFPKDVDKMATKYDASRKFLGKDVTSSKTHAKYRDVSPMTCTCKLEHFKHWWDYTHAVPTYMQNWIGQWSTGIKISHTEPCSWPWWILFIFPRSSHSPNWSSIIQPSSLIKNNLLWNRRNTGNDPERSSGVTSTVTSFNVNF